jgi:hypothetical protein
MLDIGKTAKELKDEEIDRIMTLAALLNKSHITAKMLQSKSYVFRAILLDSLEHELLMQY